MKKILANMSYILVTSIKYTGAIFAIIGFIGLFAPLTDCSSMQEGMTKKIIWSCMVLVGIWILVFLATTSFVLLKKKYKLFDVNDGHSVFVQYGDIFSPNEISSTDKRRNIVIPVNRCFDTIVDDDLISSNTLHGKCMKQLYNKNLFTPESLNNEIQNWLANTESSFEYIERRLKRSGNLKRYDVGSVAEIKNNDINFFFLALTTFDKELHAHTSDEEYVLALMKMIIYSNKRSQGFPLLVPLIGAGAADTKKQERDILEFLVKLIKMNRNLINCDVHIIVRNTAKNRVAITNL